MIMASWIETGHEPLNKYLIARKTFFAVKLITLPRKLYPRIYVFFVYNIVLLLSDREL